MKVGDQHCKNCHKRLNKAPVSVYIKELKLRRFSQNGN